MKALTECGCGMVGAWVTPWCKMLRADASKDILHLWYKLRWLQEEIEKRSSYLGKLRRTEEAKHLLDLIAMTADEEDLFYPFAKAAMADVSDALQLYMPRCEKAYLWREGRTVVQIGTMPNYKLTVVANDLRLKGDGSVHGQIAFAIEGFDREQYGFTTTLTLTYTTEYRIKATHAKKTEKHTISMGIEPEYDEEKGQWVYTTEDLYLDVLGEDEETTAEEVVSLDSADISIYVFKIAKTTFKQDDWVEIGGKLYIALTDGNEQDTEGKLMEAEGDYRDSIHYVLALPRGMNLSYIEPLDTAVFETLVARIIYRWLQYSYPDEAVRYLEEYTERMEQIRKRCSMLFAEKIVNRIPRAF